MRIAYAFCIRCPFPGWDVLNPPALEPRADVKGIESLSLVRYSDACCWQSNPPRYQIQLEKLPQVPVG